MKKILSHKYLKKIYKSILINFIFFKNKTSFLDQMKIKIFILIFLIFFILKHFTMIQIYYDYYNMKTLKLKKVFIKFYWSKKSILIKISYQIIKLMFRLKIEILF